MILCMCVKKRRGVKVNRKGVRSRSGCVYRVIHAIINECRRQNDKRLISYGGLIKAMKRYGLVKKISLS